MKKTITVGINFTIYVLLIIFIVSCENKCNIQKDIEELKIERANLKKENDKLSILKRNKYSEISKLDEQIKELKIYQNGSIPKYYIKLNFISTSLSVSTSTINSFSIELPVDKSFYDTHNVGDSYGRMRVHSKWVGCDSKN